MKRITFRGKPPPVPRSTSTARRARPPLGTKKKIFPKLASFGTVAELFSLLRAHELRPWPRRPAD